jgi:PKD repeat protein
MSRLSVVRLLLPILVFALVLAVLSIATALARADSYGELGHLGSAGTGNGQFRFTGPTINGTNGTRAFGVNPTGDAVYVGDEPKAKEYRIQELTPAGAFVAATAGFKPPNRQGLEGIAFDPALKRLYVLALERRGVLENDSGKPAAGTLYAFSTEATGGVLPPASGTVGGVLTGPTAFKSQSDVLGDALLRPKGIAVDPTNHDVIVMGELDEGSEVFSFALQRVDGSTGALGARYVDHSGLLTPAGEPNSPVVSPGGAVYVEQIPGEEHVAQILRIPSDFTSSQPPMPFIRFISQGLLESEANAVVELANGSGGDSLEGGGGLWLTPEGNGESTIYAEARVFESDGSGGGAFYTGALAFKDVNDVQGSELGWTGGQSRQTTESCAIGAAGPVPPMVAGGAAGTVFILDPKFSRVDEFGPGGSGCPTAEAGELTATANGAPLSGTIPGGTEVTLATSLTRANALSVEWSFGEGEAKPLVVSTDEYQHTQITHTFEKGGELTVTETIHTDNLATPTIVKTRKITVRTNHIPPTAVISGPVSIGVGQPATFDGSASWDPNGAPGSSPVKTYRWDFGDGDSTTGETPEVEHTYAQTGIYNVKLTVVDGFGLESEASTISVTVNVPVPPKHEETPPGPTGGPVGPQLPLAPIGPVLPPPEEKTPGQQVLPVVRLADTSLTVAASGAVSLALVCPGGASSCAGTVTLHSAGPLSVASGRSSHKHAKPVVLTFAKGNFKIAGGHQESLALRLSAAARRLLTHGGSLHALVTIVAHDAMGATHTTQVVVGLKVATVRKGHK